MVATGGGFPETQYYGKKRKGSIVLSDSRESSKRGRKAIAGRVGDRARIVRIFWRGNVR
jgi:hypothetical protein